MNRQTIYKVFIFCTMASLQSVNAEAQAAGKTVLGVFDGRTPCRELAVLLQEDVTDICIKIKWRLTLYQEGEYELEGFVYKRGTPRRGKWVALKGTKADPAATVLRLDVMDGKPALFLQKADENVLLFLDANRRLMVGNNNFSYALNKKGMEN